MEKEGVSIESTSLSCGYTALDFAEWFQTKGNNPVGCAEVISYLRGCARMISYLRHQATIADAADPELFNAAREISADDI